jgi:hypothetical protein
MKKNNINVMTRMAINGEKMAKWGGKNDGDRKFN